MSPLPACQAFSSCPFPRPQFPPAHTRPPGLRCRGQPQDAAGTNRPPNAPLARCPRRRCLLSAAQPIHRRELKAARRSQTQPGRQDTGMYSFLPSFPGLQSSSASPSPLQTGSSAPLSLLLLSGWMGSVRSPSR